MIYLKQSLIAWTTPDFIETLVAELSQLDPEQLPLQAGLSSSSVAITDNIEIIILSCSEQGNQIHIKAGVFYQGLIAGCSCADDPTPGDSINEYCELLITIDRNNAETEIHLL